MRKTRSFVKCLCEKAACVGRWFRHESLQFPCVGARSIFYDRTALLDGFAKQSGSRRTVSHLGRFSRHYTPRMRKFSARRKGAIPMTPYSVFVSHSMKQEDLGGRVTSSEER